MEAEEVYHCGRCGLCLTECPVYANLREESSGPRGKIQLIKFFLENELPSSCRLNKLVTKCLMCGTCTTNCPSGIRHITLFMRMRSLMNAEYGVDWKLKLFFHLLGNNQQLAFAQKIALLGFNRAVEKVLARAKIGNISVEKLAKLNPVPFRDQIEESIGPSVKSRGTVLYFTGCATHFIFENIGKAVVNVIRKLGFRLVVPKDQMCCAIPMFFSGELKKAKKNIEKNIEIFNRPEIVAVLVDCVSCESALNTYYESILQELKIDTTHARELAGKVKNISDFIFENLEYLRPFLKTKTKNLLSVTYHSPCHLRNNEKTSGKSEELLRQFSNIQYLKAKDTNSCCGGGGTFCFYHPQISQKIARNKLNNANETNAEYLATDCPSCRMNLNGNLETDDKIKLIHPVEVIDMFIEKRISADR